MALPNEVNVGTSPNNGTGDPLREGGQKINANFVYLDENKQDISEKGAANGYVGLNANVKIGNEYIQMPVMPVETVPTTGEENVLYTESSTGSLKIWNGTDYDIYGGGSIGYQDVVDALGYVPESDLGNPVSNDMVLASDTAGNRYWVVQESSGGGVTQQYVDDADAATLASANTYTDEKTVNLSKDIGTLIELREYEGSTGEAVNVLGRGKKGDGLIAPFPFIWDDDSEEADNDATIIQVTGVTVGRWKVDVGDSIRTEYFGVNSSMTSLERKEAIQTMFDIALSTTDIVNVTIGVGVHLISGSSLVYQANNTDLFFEGTLKLDDNAGSLTGTQIIGYDADNIRVYNQKLDGNRANNPVSSTKGNQFTFTTYGNQNISFIGGEVINAAQNHVQSTSENVLFLDKKFDTSGEHGLYLTLSTNDPKQKVRVIDCEIINFAIHVVGVGISVRDYRSAIIENCTIDPTDSVKPEGCGHIDSYIEYDSTIGVGETVKIEVNNCNLLPGAGLSYSVQGRKKDESGVYINGGLIEYVTSGVVINASNATFKIKEFSTWGSIPETVDNCDIYHLSGLEPNQSFTIKNSNLFYEGTEAVGIDIFNGGLTEGNVILSNNSYYDYLNIGTQGLIRTKTGVKTIVEDSKIYNCTGTFVYSRSVLDEIKGNRDMTGGLSTSPVRYDSKPFILKNNTFISEEGATANRPSIVKEGFKFFDTDLGRPIWKAVSGWIDIYQKAYDDAVAWVKSKGLGTTLATIDDIDLVADTSIGYANAKTPDGEAGYLFSLVRSSSFIAQLFTGVNSGSFQLRLKRLGTWESWIELVSETTLTTTPRQFTAQQGFDEFALTDAATVNWDLNKQVARLQAVSESSGGAGNSRALTISNSNPGVNYQLTYIQDDTGGRELDLSGFDSVIGEIDLSANGESVLTLLVTNSGKSIVVITSDVSVSEIDNITEIPNRSYNDLQDLPNIYGYEPKLISGSTYEVIESDKGKILFFTQSSGTVTINIPEDTFSDPTQLIMYPGGNSVVFDESVGNVFIASNPLGTKKEGLPFGRLDLAIDDVNNTAALTGNLVKEYEITASPDGTLWKTGQVDNSGNPVAPTAL